MASAGEVVRAADVVGDEAWTNYTPTWTGTTNPAIQNGTLSGRFKEVGTTVHFVIDVTMGSSTTFGSGPWSFGLPVPAVDLAHPGAFPAVLLDISPTNRDIGVGTLGTVNDFLIIADSSASGLVTNLHPWTWANGDIVRVSGTYEKAP